MRAITMATTSEFESILDQDNYNVVYVNVPEIELDENNKVILGSHSLTLPVKTDGLFEVPPAIAEETIESYVAEPFLQVTPKTESPMNTTQHFPDIPNIHSPKITVRSFASLEADQAEPPRKEKYDDDEDYTPQVKKPKDRRKQVFPKFTSTEKPILTTCLSQNKSKSLPKTTSSPTDDPHQGKDLMWLLNFKLDNFLQDNPLDAQPGSPKENSPRKTEKFSSEDPEEEEIQKKPPFTYTELIECALVEKGPLTVSEIYQWISDMFPYYKAWDDRWKNSVRHNLSINPYFRKGGKAKQGAGHLWTVSEAADTPRSLNAKRQRYEEFEAYTKRIKLQKSNKQQIEAQKSQCAMDDQREAEIAASIIYNIIEDKENRCHGEIKQRAEEILNGVKREVAVEYIEPITPAAGNDFLNPVSKEDLMGECGFFNQIELSMTAESTDNFETIEIESTYEQLDDLGFQFNDLNCHNVNITPLVN